MSHALAGPNAGMILADMGAQVIKLEHPHGDHFRPLLGGAYYAAVNRNKRGISLDIKHPEGQAATMKIIERSDVLLESFTPGTMDKLGLGYEQISKLNPRIIYCSISGFGQKGPYRQLPGYDVVAQAMCGIMMCTGMPGGPPVRIGASWIDMGAGMFTVIGVLKAIIDRQQTGRGKHIDVSLMDTASILDVSFDCTLLDVRRVAQTHRICPGSLFTLSGLCVQRRVRIHRCFNGKILENALHAAQDGAFAGGYPVCNQ